MSKILLIEDDQVMRENTAEILELANYEVHTAENGKLGSFKAIEFCPDLIICDIMMPELDGYGVLHVLSKNPKTSSIPFIFLTAKAEKSEVRKGMNLGADDYLTKPFEETELLNSIEMRLKKCNSIKKNIDSEQDLISFLENAESNGGLEDITRNQKTSKYKKKENLFREGDIPQQLFFIDSGKVKAFKTSDDGKELITHVYGKGDFFGYSSLLQGREYPVTAVALEESQICKISKKDFFQLMHKNKDVSSHLIKLMAKNVAEAEEQLLSLAYDTVRKRAANALLTLESKFKSTENSDPTKIKATRDDIAAIAGTATETLIRCLGEFKEDGLIDVEGRSILILDVDGLSDIQY